MDVTELIYNGTKITDSVEIANTFNEHFVNAGPRVHASITKTKNSTDESDVDSVTCASRMKFKKVSELSLCRIVERLKPKTSCGMDGISNILLEQVHIGK